MDLFLFFLAAILLSYYIYKIGTKNFDYFEKRNFPFIRPIFLIGTSRDTIFGRKTIIEYLVDNYKKMSNYKIYGSFEMGRPSMFVRDPELIKQLTIKDFDHFPDHFSIFDEEMDPLMANSLVMMKGQKWRDMRATLSPAFTGSKMRQMFVLVNRAGINMAKYFVSETKTGNRTYEMKDIFSRFANDVIASTAFGYEVNSLSERNNEFFKMGKILSDFSRRDFLLKALGYNLCPRLMKWLNISMTDRTTRDYFRGLIGDTMRIRETSGCIRHDMIHLLMQAKSGKLTQIDEGSAREGEGFATVEESSVGKRAVKREWNENDMSAQCFLFFIAGFDTVSTLLSLLSYELAINLDIQAKLYNEIRQVEESLEGETLTYEALQKMKYLDMVVSEGLRKWPPSLFIDRMCAKDYHHSNNQDLDFTIERGIQFWIPIYAIHHDAKHYPHPEKFDPERFSDANKHEINPLAYLPFGTGPRNCIGSRFALMEVKIVLYNLLRHISIETTTETQIPIKFAKFKIMLVPERGVWLKFTPRIVIK